MVERRHGHLGFESSEVPPSALDNKLLDASMGAMRSIGSSIGQGNLVLANPTWKISGKMMAASQQMVFCLMSLDLSDLVMLVSVLASAIAMGAMPPGHDDFG